MGNLTDRYFEHREAKAQERIARTKIRVAERETKLDDIRQKAIAKAGAAHQAKLDGTKDKSKDDIDAMIQSILDSDRAASGVTGDGAADQEDSRRLMLRHERSVRGMGFDSLRTGAINATARLIGIAPRGTGYDGPTSQGRLAVVGPLVLTGVITMFEAVPSAGWFSDRFALWMPSASGLTRSVLPWIAAISLTSVVMAITFMAGRKLKAGMVARRASKAERAGTGSGGELGAGIALVGIAALLQTITLALRLSTDSGDADAQSGLLLLALLSFFGSIAVLVTEYASYTPTANNGVAVNTRQSDANTVREFRFSEQRLQVGIETDENQIDISELRRTEKALERLQGPAREVGDAQIQVLNDELAEVRDAIRRIYKMEETYQPEDLEALARQAYPTLTAIPFRDVA